MKTARVISIYVTSFLLSGIGVIHFVRVEDFLKIIPPFVPFPLACVYVSGALEILFGLGLLVKRVRKFAALGLMVLLIAVFPANIYMYTSGLFPQFPDWVLLMRLPLQMVLIGWVWWIGAMRTQR